MIMAKVIVYQNDQGGVTILTPAPQAREQVLVSPAQFATSIESFTSETRDEENNVIFNTVLSPVSTKIAEAVYREETDDEFLNRIADKDVPKGTKHYIVDESVFPSDRKLRPSWKLDRNKRNVVEDATAAKAALSSERDRILTVLDRRLSAAILRGDPVDDITAKLSEAGALLSQIDSATTVQELRSLADSIKALKEA
jgi:hypothetical protein